MLARAEGQPDEGELVVAAQAGRAEAFACLVGRYQPRVLRFLYHESGDAELAADLTQETLLAGWRSIRQLRDPDAFGPWLYRIARNNLHMARRRGRSPLSLDWLTERASRLIPALHRADTTTPAGERDAIQIALDTLTPALREALLRHALWGFTGSEIADMTGISISAARKRVARAEQQFRERYDVTQSSTPGVSHDQHL
jgi:RNA polymerase sigma-70 factor (ECF subfamily)